jgi:hypothetical protein
MFVSGESFLLVVLHMFHPVSLVLVRGVIVVCCLNCVLAFIVSCVVQLLSSLPSYLKKKKKLHFSSLVVVTIGVITYGIRAGSTRDLGTLWLSLI